jgi:hypothetical protein
VKALLQGRGGECRDKGLKSRFAGRGVPRQTKGGRRGDGELVQTRFAGRAGVKERCRVVSAPGRSIRLREDDRQGADPCDSRPGRRVLEVSHRACATFFPETWQTGVRGKAALPRRNPTAATGSRVRENCVGPDHLSVNNVTDTNLARVSGTENC